MAYWGYHLMLDCASCDKDKITDKQNIINFTKALVERIDMKAFGEPQVIHFGEDDKMGHTAIQLISTSNFMLHAVDSSGDIYFDCFSCKPYDIATVESVFRKYFSPTRMRVNFITRQA